MPIGVCIRVKEVSSETRKKMSERHKGHKVSYETRTKISKAVTGKKRTEEQCRAIFDRVFQGNSASQAAGRQRAQKLYPVPLPCKCCGVTAQEARIDRHHKDGNTLNNAFDNIEFLCASCHTKQHIFEWLDPPGAKSEVMPL